MNFRQHRFQCWQISVNVVQRGNPHPLMDGTGLAIHVVHQQILTQVVRSCEVSFAAAHLGHLLDERDQVIIVRQHERVDQNARLLATVYFLKRTADD